MFRQEFYSPFSVAIVVHTSGNGFGQNPRLTTLGTRFHVTIHAIDFGTTLFVVSFCTNGAFSGGGGGGCIHSSSSSRLYNWIQTNKQELYPTKINFFVGLGAKSNVRYEMKERFPNFPNNCIANCAGCTIGHIYECWI